MIKRRRLHCGKSKSFWRLMHIVWLICDIWRCLWIQIQLNVHHLVYRGWSTTILLLLLGLFRFIEKLFRLRYRVVLLSANIQIVFVIKVCLMPIGGISNNGRRLVILQLILAYKVTACLSMMWYHSLWFLPLIWLCFLIIGWVLSFTLRQEMLLKKNFIFP